MTISRRKVSVLSSISGRGTFASSNEKKIAKEHFEQNLDNIFLENISNPKTYWKIMKMLIKSNKGCSNIPPLQNLVFVDI
jgi:hypothetical protein